MEPLDERFAEHARELGLARARRWAGSSSADGASDPEVRLVAWLALEGQEAVCERDVLRRFVQNAKLELESGIDADEFRARVARGIRALESTDDDGEPA